MKIDIDLDDINRRFWRKNQIEQETYARLQKRKAAQNERNDDRLSDSMGGCDTNSPASANLG